MRDLITTDLFKMSKILKKMNIKNEIKGLFTDVTGKKEEEKKEIGQDVGIQLAFIVMENMYLAEKEITDFLADMTGKTKDEISKQKPVETIKMFEELFSQEDFKVFFSQAVK